MATADVQVENVLADIKQGKRFEIASTMLGPDKKRKDLWEAFLFVETIWQTPTGRERRSKGLITIEGSTKQECIDRIAAVVSIKGVTVLKAKPGDANYAELLADTSDACVKCGCTVANACLVLDAGAKTPRGCAWVEAEDKLICDACHLPKGSTRMQGPRRPLPH